MYKFAQIFADKGNVIEGIAEVMETENLTVYTRYEYEYDTFDEYINTFATYQEAVDYRDMKAE